MATDRPEFVDPFATPSTEEYDPNEYEGKFQEFGEGVVSGATKLVQGPLELLAQAQGISLDQRPQEVSPMIWVELAKGLKKLERYRKR